MSEVTLEIDAGVAVLRLDATRRRNALTQSMAAEMVSACEAIDEDGSVAAAVVTGGEWFCAGADLSMLARTRADPASEDAYGAVGSVYDAFLRVGRLEVATIAAVRGAAVGAGLNLALATDLRIVARDARLISRFVELGVHPGGGHFLLATRAAGREAAAAMALFGEEIRGDRAAELGLAWEAHEDAHVEGRARELAARLAADPVLARSAVRSFRLETGPPQATWDLAVLAERAPQMWSFRRRNG